METKRGSNNRVRWIQRGVIAIAVVALLAGAAYVWGNRLSADTLQASARSSAEASASLYDSLRGVPAVRAADSAAANQLRAAEASTLRWAGLGEQYQKRVAANQSAERAAASASSMWAESQHKDLNLGTPAVQSAVQAIAPAAGMPAELEKYLHQGTSANPPAAPVVGMPIELQQKYLQETSANPPAAPVVGMPIELQQEYLDR